MTTLRTEAYTLPAAEIGPENPLPMFRGPEDDGAVGLDEGISEEDRRYMGWRTAGRVLPYRMQDEYSRSKPVRDLDSLVIENGFVKAIFLPGAGGRMVSLFDKPSGRELLQRNPVFQPANLALRNAWLSGGIEWNAGQPGHHYLTCAPVFAAQTEGPDGTPGLRIYEWDRVKGFAWQIDFWLPAESPLLFARTRIVNPHPWEIAMYWWTNIAVDEREDVRVLVPAETALCNPYWKSIQVVDLPRSGGRDMTYSTQAPHAADFFSRIPDNRRKWVAALGADGRGFFEASTNRLRGRKLFCWGMGQGGRQWQEFLAAPGQAYIEIQAGLARTQMECVPMPAETDWTWTEAFGYLEADAARVHSNDWATAWAAAGERIEEALPCRRMDEVDALLAGVTVRPPSRILRTGSGWGALERLRRASQGEPDRVPAELLFEEATLGPEQEPWLTLLTDGVLPTSDPDHNPGALMTQPEWRTPIEKSVETGAGDHWLSWWHLGNARMEGRDVDGACRAWQESLLRSPTGWALRNLAVAAQRRGDDDQHLALLTQAWEVGPKVTALAIECAQALLAARRFPDLLLFVRGLPEDLRTHERLMMLWAKAALETGEIDGVECIFDHEFATIREGEVTLTDLWFAWHERRLAAKEGVEVDAALQRRVRWEFPPPKRIDFRMAGAIEAPAPPQASSETGANQ